jgi:cell shape-determining protein MreD
MSEVARVREGVLNIFPQVYFTIMSVIQGVAMGVLSYTLFSIFAEHRTIAIGTAARAGMSFGGMIIVTFEYSYYVALARRPPFIRDISAPFVLGITQLAPLFVIDEPLQWWIVTGLFATFGTGAYVNSLIGIRYERKLALNKEFYDVIDVGQFLSATLVHCVLTSTIALLCMWHAYLIYTNVGDITNEVAATVLLIALMNGIWATSKYFYLNPLYQRLGVSP